MESIITGLEAQWASISCPVVEARPVSGQSTVPKPVGFPYEDGFLDMSSSTTAIVGYA